jgi:hypothetical protein
MEVYVPTLEMALVEIIVGGILGGIIRPLGWALSVVSTIGFVVSLYLFLGINPNTVNTITTGEMAEKMSIVIIGGVNFLIHTALFDTGATIVNKIRAAFSSSNR